MTDATFNFTKNAADTVDYDLSFLKWLSDTDGDYLTSATVSVTSGTATVIDHQVSNDAVKVWMMGGSAGEITHVEILAATHGGRIKKACLRLRIKECV